MASSSWASSTTQQPTPAEITRLLEDFDSQIRKAVEDGSASVFVTMMRIGFRMRELFSLQKSSPAVRAAFPEQLFLYVFLRVWGNKEKREAPDFLDQLRTELRRFDQDKTSHPMLAASVHAQSATVQPTPAPSIPAGHKAATSNSAPPKPVPPISAAPIPMPAVSIPATPKPSRPKAAVSMSVVLTPAAPKTATTMSAVPKPAKRPVSRSATPMTAISKSAAPMPAASKSAAPKLAGGKAEEKKTMFEESSGSSSTDEVQQHALRRRVQSRRVRREPAKAGGYHNPPCDRCTRGKRPCFKEAGKGSCYGCIRFKKGCDYAKGKKLLIRDSGSEWDSGSEDSRDEDETLAEEGKGGEKRKGKGKAKAQPKSKEINEKDGPDPQGSKSEGRWVDVSDEEPVKKPKRPTRACNQAKPAATTERAVGDEDAFRGLQAQLKQQASLFQDTCNDISSRVKLMESHMIDVVMYLRQVLQRLPEETESTNTRGSEDDMYMDIDQSAVLQVAAHLPLPPSAVSAPPAVSVVPAVFAATVAPPVETADASFAVDHDSATVEALLIPESAASPPRDPPASHPEDFGFIFIPEFDTPESVASPPRDPPTPSFSLNQHLEDIFIPEFDSPPPPTPPTAEPNAGISGRMTYSRSNPPSPPPSPGRKRKTDDSSPVRAGKRRKSGPVRAGRRLK